MNTSPVVLITGAAKRIGACTARTFHQAGYRVVVHYNRSRDAALALSHELNQRQENSCALVQADLSEITQLEELAQRSAEQFGQLNVLVNNASSFYPTPIGDIKMADWQELFATNCQAPLFLSQSLAPVLSEAQGAIINLTDIHAQRPLRNHTVYCMAKSALITMTQSLAKELAPNIRINGVSPGVILWPEVALPEKEKAKVLSEIPLEKIGSPEDIAKTILFLAQSPYITGQIIAVDGGRSVGGDAIA